MEIRNTPGHLLSQMVSSVAIRTQAYRFATDLEDVVLFGATESELCLDVSNAGEDGYVHGNGVRTDQVYALSRGLLW